MKGDEIMNKKVKFVLVTVSVALVFAALIGLWIGTRNVNIMKDVDINEIEKIEIYQNNKASILSEENDVKEFVKLFESMELDKTFSNSKEGYAFSIDVYYKNGKESKIIVRSSEIIIDCKFYKCDKSYCDDVRKIYEAHIEQ